LVGSAELDFWKQLLENEVLAPIERDGKAQLLIIAAAMRFKGIRFRELSFSVLVRRKQTEAAFLVQAFNTVRFFAFVERNLFSAPYCHGSVQLDVGAPAFARAADRSGGGFSAEMASDPARQPHRVGESGWEGDVVLPRRGNKNATRKHFFARIRGETQSYRFIADDRIKIQPSARSPIFQWLLDSGFEGQEWSIRENARHCKSKTMVDRIPPAA
jgi:hypothetical protein